MISKSGSPLLALVASLALLSGCATMAPPERAVSENSAVLALVESARVSLDKGEAAAATASLERALRIESKNPLLWQELARVRLREGNYQQAESLAARSNGWAGGDRAILAANWRLISEARAGRGDGEGARAALERAMSFDY